MAATRHAGAASEGHYPEGDGPRLQGFDFRRRSRFSRDQVRALEIAHELFARRFASAVGNSLRTLVQLEPISTDEVSYDDYIRSMPNPNLLAVVGLSPLPGPVLLEMNVQLALQLVDRMLGGRGQPVGLRRPTELETYLLRDIIRLADDSLQDALEPTGEVAPELGTIEYNPQLVTVCPPGDMVLLLTYRMAIPQSGAEGLLTLCYPASTLAPALDRLAAQAWSEQAAVRSGQDEESRRLLSDSLADVDVTLSVRLDDSAVPAADLAALRVGDVLRLDHRADQPVRGHVAGVDLLEGHLGRRGRRLALQVTRRADPPPAEAPPAPAGE